MSATVQWNRAIGAAVLLLGALAARAQDAEPRRWSHLPVNVNYTGLAYIYTEADIAFDPVLELDDVTMEAHTVAAKIVRSFALFKRLCRVEMLVPYQQASWEGILQGLPASTERTGFADPIARVAVNLVGAPPLARPDYAAYRKEHQETTTVGAGLSVQAPLGEYHKEKLLNLGDNRFTFRPELGVEHSHGPWSEEITGTLWLYTENDEFWKGASTREQDPMLGLQGHLVYTFRPGLWLSGGAGYYAGGASTINGVSKDDERGILLMGCSLGIPVSRTVGVKLGYLRNRSTEDIGADSDSVLVSISALW
jgi:hypothetical protein